MRRITYLVGLLVVSLAVAAPVSAQSQPEKGSSKGAAAAGAPLNLNTATSAQLETLPGIGPAAAKRIIEYRQKNGSFKKAEELMNVKGIGEKSFLKLKPLVTVAGDKAEKPSGER